MVTLLTDVVRKIVQLGNEMMFLIVFVVYPLALLSLIVLSLRPHLGRLPFWGLTFSNAVFCYWLSTEGAGSDDRFGLGVVISFSVILLFLICFAIGVSIHIFGKKEKTADNRSMDVLSALVTSAPIPANTAVSTGYFCALEWHTCFRSAGRRCSRLGPSCFSESARSPANDAV